jgi:SAM-dependent methyltransferase
LHHHPNTSAQAVAVESAVDIDGLVRFFHEEARLERRLGPDGTVSDRVSKWTEELMALRTAYDLVHQRRGTVGTMPPTPHTARAQVGAFLVRLVQRMMFWYTPQINEFNEAVTRALNHVCATLESQLATAQGLSAEIAKLRLEVSSLAVRERGHLPSAPAQEDALPESFYAAFQEHFRGSERETGDRLARYLAIIDSLGKDNDGAWLDFGCGRGEWLTCAADAGHSVIGVDTSAEAVRHCAERRLRAKQSDALVFLEAREDASASVITAFHVLEHWTAPYILRFVAEAARVLQPGGLLIVELPNPENLLMGARDFWADPTHLRPIPPPTMEFIFNYCGFAIRRRLDLHPAPERELLPFHEHEVVQRLNHYLHGPQAFALVGQL